MYIFVSNNPIKMKKIILAISLLQTCFTLCTAQLIKQWDYRFGGTAIDEFHDIILTDDGGYLLAGYSESGIGGDKTTVSQGSGDFWIIKINSSGIKQWEKDFGGSNYDELFEVQQTFDGGYILGGWSNSGISGDKTQASFGAGDYWVVKTDNNGNLQWERTFGGSSEDYLQSIKQTADSGFILAGRSNSGISGSKTQANRGTVGVTWDYWAVKINKLGTKQWDQTYGGFDDDQLFSVELTSDGGYIFGGYSNSGITGEKSEVSRGLDDYWIVKTNASGVKQWDKTFGGTSVDQLQMVLPTSDGGYLLGGGSASGANGDKSQASRGNFDYWILKTNAAGTKLWDKRFGGSSADNLFDLIATSDGGYLLGGASSSAANGDKSQGNQGTVGTSFDYWAIKIDAAGTAQVDKRFGGTADDYAKSLCAAGDGNYVIAGWSTSGLNGDKSQGSRGSIDYWLAKVSGPNSITTLPLSSPQCTGSLINIDFTVTGTYSAGNTFTALLSDANGSFAAPTTIGSLSSTTGGTIAGSLSLLLPAGSLYQIQVVSNNPVSSDIYPCAAFQLNSATQYFLDADNDTYGNAGSTIYSCSPVAGYVLNGNDCNDNDPLIYQLPNAASGIVALSSNCDGSSGNIFDANAIFQATSYQWLLSSGITSTAPGNETTDTLITLAFALGSSNETLKVLGKNSCGTGDTASISISVEQLPAAAGSISGSTQISACSNQNGIGYSVANIANASTYVWSLPDSATLISGAGTNSIGVNYSAYGLSGLLSVYGTNVCGNGNSSSAAISYKPIPTAQICGISVDSAEQIGVLLWQKPIETYADSIVIMRKNSSTFLYDIIKTVANASPSRFVDSTSNPNFKAETYKIAVKDSCGNVGDTSIAVTHKTIFLYGLTGWQSIPKLYWTPYEGLNDTNLYYNVLRDNTGNGPFIVIKDSIKYNEPLSYTDAFGAACLSCRYIIELFAESTCNPNLRTMASKSISRSNIANRILMPFDTLLTGISRNHYNTIIFDIQPNPTQGNFYLVFENSLKECKVEIYNPLQQVVWYEKFANIMIGEHYKVSVDNLPPSIYIVKVTDNITERASFKKFIVNN